MKLKKVAALCAKLWTFHLFDEVGEDGEFIRQWLGDGRAAYPLSGLPVLDEENLCAMFDIPEKKWNECFFSRKPLPVGLNVADCAKGEQTLYDTWPTIEHNGYVLKPLSTNDDVLFIQTAHLSPLEDMADYLQLYKRVSNTGQAYIVAKNGLEIAAVIMPVNANNIAFVEKLEELVYKCRMAQKRREEREREKAMLLEPGPLFREEEADGEGMEAGKCFVLEE